MKNKYLLRGVLLTLLLTFMTGCGSKDSLGTSSAKDTQSAKQKNISVQQLATEKSTRKKNIEQDIAKLLTLKSDDYETYTLDDFSNYVETHMYKSQNADAYIESYENVVDTISEDMDHYDFFLSLKFTIDELYSQSTGDSSVDIYRCFIQYGNPIANSADKEPVYDYLFLAPCNLSYNIENGSNITVKERNQLFTDYVQKLQSTVDNLSISEMADSGITEKLQSEFDSISNSISNERLHFSNKIELTEYMEN